MRIRARTASHSRATPDVEVDRVTVGSTTASEPSNGGAAKPCRFMALASKQNSNVPLTAAVRSNSIVTLPFRLLCTATFGLGSNTGVISTGRITFSLPARSLEVFVRKTRLESIIAPCHCPLDVAGTKDAYYMLVLMREGNIIILSNVLTESRS